MKRPLARFKSPDRKFQKQDKKSDKDKNFAAITTSSQPETLDIATPALETAVPQPVYQESYEGLEALPPEIRRHLLALLDLVQLKGLVHASPVFHQQYILDRIYILRSSLEATLGIVAADAYAAQVCEPQTKDSAEEAIRILDSRQSPMASLSQPEVERMANFHLRYVVPVMETFVRQTLNNLGRETMGVKKNSWIPPFSTSPLSNSETLRIMRAIYCFQILCKIAVRFEGQMISDFPNPREARIERLIEVSHPWEIEGLLACYKFAIKKYDAVFDKIEEDLHPDNPRFDGQGRPPTPDGAFELGSQWSREVYLEGTARNGLSLLRSVMFDIKNHDVLVETMQQHMSQSYIPISGSEGILGTHHQGDRRENKPCDKDRLQEARAPLPFRGDGDTNAPPFAWTVVWEGTYSNLYGSCIRENLRDWGYVFWDAKRIEEAGGRDFVNDRKGWTEDDDPRDEMWIGD